MSTNYIIEHTHFVRARNALFSALDEAKGGDLIHVIALSGAGKSELRKAAMRRMAGNPAHWGTGRLPVIFARASPTERSVFNSKEFTKRLLNSVRAPDLRWLIDNRDLVTAIQQRFVEDGDVARKFWAPLKTLPTETEMRDAFELCAKAREVKFVFVEETQSMCVVKIRQSPTDHMDSMKCLAEEIDAVFVFFGTPRMVNLWAANGEIRRRSIHIYVDRYVISQEKERVGFGKLLVSLADFRPLQSPNLLYENLELIYMATFGVFGEVRAMISRASMLARSEDRPWITKDDLERSIYNATELGDLLKEVIFFDRCKQPTELESAAELAKKVGRRKGPTKSELAHKTAQPPSPNEESGLGN